MATTVRAFVQPAHVRTVHSHPVLKCTSFVVDKTASTLHAHRHRRRPFRHTANPVIATPLTATPLTATPRCISGAESAADIGSAGTPPSSSPPTRTRRSLSALIKFTRPHTIRGTIIGSISGCARALLESSGMVDWTLLPRALFGLLALLLGNAFIVGVNQIYDVRVDRINKPFLPLAANEMTPRFAWAVVISSALLGLAIVRRLFSRLIFNLYAFGMLFGALYSIPPFRFKRFPILAAITISCVRGFLMNFGVYHATKSALNLPFAWSPPITFLAIFMSVFAAVIALSKDLPDIEGDIAEGVPTFASTIGPGRMVSTVYLMLSLNYIGAILTAIFAPSGAFNRPALGVGHFVLGAWLISYMPRVDPSSLKSVKKFYAFIWKLFYAEYLLFPFI